MIKLIIRTTYGSIYLFAALENFYFLNFQETSGTTVASEGRSGWRKAGNNSTKFSYLDSRFYELLFQSQSFTIKK